jgi:hypothetical protein
MNRSILALVAGLLSIACSAQRYGEQWQFGNEVGLEFSDCAPKVLLNGSNDGFEGCSTVSNEQGELLFYTNSETVWNRLHEPMPNGELVAGGGSLSQVLIQKVPLSTSLYYIFTTTGQASAAGRFRYHVVDMGADDGFGDVITDDQVLFTGTTTEHVAATGHANGTDVWIMARAYPQAEFLAYRLTPAGIVDAPVVSSVGPPLIPGNSNFNTRGELKFSMDGARMAIACNGIAANDNTNLLALYDFDNSTGMVSNAIVLPTGRGDFGLSFSPLGTKLYSSTWKAFGFSVNDVNTLHQFDLTNNEPAAIIASRTLLYTSSSETLGSLKLGPDGRIYLAAYGSTYLGVINDPDSLGEACNYVHEGVFLDGGTCEHGLNNYIEYVYCAPLVTGLAESTAMHFSLSIHPNPSTGLVSIDLPGSGGPYRIRVTDPTGRVLLEERALKSGTIDLSDHGPGNYHLTVCNDQHTCTDRVVMLTQ